MGTCKKIAGMIGAYVYGDLSPDEMRCVRLHAEECSKCSREIEDRIRTIALIPTDTPTLTDEERQRVVWTVKGAIRAKNERRRFSLFRPTFAQGIVLTTLLAAAFAGGAMLGYSKIHPKVIVKQVTAEKQQPAENPDKRVAADTAPKPVSKPLIHTQRPIGMSVAVQPFVRYPMQEIYRGSIDRESQKQEDASASILGDKSSESAQRDQSTDPLGPSIVPVPDPLSSTITEPDLLSPAPAPVEPKGEKPASSDDNQHE